MSCRRKRPGSGSSSSDISMICFISWSATLQCQLSLLLQVSNHYQMWFSAVVGHFKLLLWMCNGFQRATNNHTMLLRRFQLSARAFCLLLISVLSGYRLLSLFASSPSFSNWSCRGKRPRSKSSSSTRLPSTGPWFWSSSQLELFALNGVHVYM